jgi:hypothetical protein
MKASTFMAHSNPQMRGAGIVSQRSTHRRRNVLLMISVDVGGMLSVGGSIFVLPVLVLVFNLETRDGIHGQAWNTKSTTCNAKPVATAESIAFPLAIRISNQA